MTKRILLTLFIICLLIIPSIKIVHAADLDEAEFALTVRVSNNSTSANTNQCVVLTGANSTAWQALEYINSSCNDSALQSAAGSDLAYMPGYGNSPWIIFEPSINGDSYKTDVLYIGGNTDMDAAIAIFADNLTISDAASMEWSDNGSANISSFVDMTQTSDNIFYKEDSMRCFVYDTDNITAIANKGYITPTGHTDPSTGWSSETNAYDDNTGTDALSDSVNDWTDWIQFDRTTEFSTGFRWYCDTANNDWEQVDADAYYNGAWNDLTDGAITLTRQAWQSAAFANGAAYRVEEYRVRFKYDDGVGGSSQIPLSEVDFIDSSVVSLGSQSSDEKNIQVATDNNSYFWGIKIDADTAGFPISSNLTLNAPFHHYDLAESTITSKDSNANTLTVTGATWSSTGRVFDGTNDKITLASAYDVISDNKDFSVAVWFYSTDADGNIVSNTHNTNNRFGLCFEGSKIRAGVYDGDYHSKSQETASQNTWYHAVATWDTDTSSMFLYVNKTNQTGTTNPSVHATAGFVIGERTDGGHDYAGTIGEIQIYDKTLTLSEVQSLYNAEVWRYNGSSEAMHYDVQPASGFADNANDWIIGSDATPYIYYYKHYVAGSLVSDIEWQYDTTFTDLSGNSNDATPSLRTTSTDSYISANITQFQPMSEATAPAYAVSEAPDFYSSNITTSGNFTSGGVSPGGMPGTAIIDDVASTGGTPNIWVWGIIAIFAIAGVGIFISYFEQRFGGGSGTMTLRIIATSLILGLLIANDVFDTWMIVLYIMISVGIAVASRHREIGGSASAHSIVGFLAMSFIGMTIINRIMEGQFITSDETAWANTFAFTQTFEVFDLFTIPVINFRFFTEGIPAIMKWDYSFFGGNAQMIQYLMYSVTAVMSFIIFGLLIGLMYNAFRVR